MSLALAADPTYTRSASRPCQWPGCRVASGARPTRLHLPGRRAPETYDLCPPHRAEAIADGVAVEKPMSMCRVVNCSAEASQRGLCASHVEAARLRGLWKPGPGMVSSVVLMALREPINPDAIELGELAGEAAATTTPAPAPVLLPGDEILIVERDERATAVVASWLAQPGVRDEVVTEAIYAVADQLIDASALVEGLHDRVALARMVLTTQLPDGLGTRLNTAAGR